MHDEHMTDVIQDYNYVLVSTIRPIIRNRIPEITIALFQEIDNTVPKIAKKPCES